jgi:hypothetical protein
MAEPNSTAPDLDSTHTYDPHLPVQNEQIRKIVLAHDSPSCVDRLIFEAIEHLFYHHTNDGLWFVEIIPFQASCPQSLPSLSLAEVSDSFYGLLGRA